MRYEYNLGALPHIIRFVKSNDPDEKNAGVGWLWSFLEQGIYIEYNNISIIK